jgi:hypothetical protein
MPKADRDWKSYLSAKDEDRKKVDRLTRTYRPLTDDVIHGHLIGEQTVGIYPLLQDETCWLLAVDFDKKAWQEDTIAFLAACSELRVPAALERSRSGKGGHVWIFFERAIPASTARKLGCAILTRTMESRHQLGLDSYDRLFPNQDTMPKGGFGNLIAIPLQKLPRANNNSILLMESSGHILINGIFWLASRECPLVPSKLWCWKRKSVETSLVSESTAPTMKTLIPGHCLRQRRGRNVKSLDLSPRRCMLSNRILYM